MVELLMKYTLQHQIVLEYKKSFIEDKPDIKSLLQNYEKEIVIRNKVYY